MGGNASFIIAIVVIAVLGLFVIPRFRMKRAVGQIIKIFRSYGALNVKSAKTVDELGLRPRTMMQGMLKGRDFKPYAMKFLLKQDIVQATEDGKLYLSEEKLYSSEIEKR